VWKAKSEVPVDGPQAATLIKLIAALEDDDDVQIVWTNAEIDEAAMAGVG
jgi:transcriptional/translational regulatory protein YebC/TACO1